MLSASLLSIVQRCGEQKLLNDIKKQYGVAPEGVSKKCFCIVLILPTRCELFQRVMADDGVDCSCTDRLWRSSSPAPTNRRSTSRRIAYRQASEDRSPGCGYAGSMGAVLELEARPARSEALLELRELYVARGALVKDRTAAKNRGKVLTLSLLKRHNAQRLEQIDRQIATVEAAILGIVEATVGLSARFAILTSIPGISNITAFALLIAMPELGAMEAGQAANLAGLAPIARQSGRWTGRSFIRGGRADVRQALYMPALVAARFNPDMKAKYAHLIETGKPAKVALTAIMRNLIVLAHALLKANRPWTPKTA